MIELDRNTIRLELGGSLGVEKLVARHKIGLFSLLDSSNNLLRLRYAGLLSVALIMDCSYTGKDGNPLYLFPFQNSILI